MKPFHRIVVISSIGIFSGTFSTTYISAYLPEMILWFGYPEHDKSYYASIFAILFSIGNFASSYGVSSLSDTRGHKRILTTMHLTNALATFAFGFCQSLIPAVLLRVVAGCCNVVLSISRAILSIFSTNTNQVSGLSIGGLLWSLGLISGSYLGGVLASPEKKYSWIFGHGAFFSKFPYFIPSALASFVSISAAITTHLMYPDEQRDENVSEDLIETSVLCPNTSHDPNYSSFSMANEPRSRRYMVEHAKPKASLHLQSAFHHSNDIIETEPTSDENNSIGKKISSAIKNSTLLKLSKNYSVKRMLPIYILFSALVDSYTVLFAVWASTTLSFGGLTYSSSEIGTVIAITAIPSAFLQLLVIPAVEKRIGAIKSTMVCLFMKAVVLNCLPMCRLIENQWTQWGVVILLQFFMQTGLMGTAITCNVLLNNTVPREEAGRVNGLARAISATGKIVGTTIICATFAASTSSSLDSPIDHNMAFVLLSLGSWTACVLTLRLPTSLNYKYMKRDEQTVTNQE